MAHKHMLVTDSRYRQAPLALRDMIDPPHYGTISYGSFPTRIRNMDCILASGPCKGSQQTGVKQEPLFAPKMLDPYLRIAAPSKPLKALSFRREQLEPPLRLLTALPRVLGSRMTLQPAAEEYSLNHKGQQLMSYAMTLSQNVLNCPPDALGLEPSGSGFGEPIWARNLGARSLVSKASRRINSGLLY